MKLVKNMKILCYKNKKGNIYEITLSNKEKITLYDDVILKYNLLITKEIKDNELNNILKDNDKIKAYLLAIKYIRVKLRTEDEIKKKLKDYDKDTINYVINRLNKEKYLNNDLYIKAYINDSINLKFEGQNKILYDLKKMKFKEDEINNYLLTIDNNTWINKIRKYIKKKIETNKSLSKIFLEKKIKEDLFNKGFYKEDIDRVLNEFIIEEDKSIYEKEYTKLKNKLSKKYSNEELEYRIKISLYKKGFNQNND